MSLYEKLAKTIQKMGISHKIAKIVSNKYLKKRDTFLWLE
ncbi:hypothetical protein LBUL_0168 [Lactobacillus delbrueckii subsp. bulgaricus ATCC BAA-365]|nr:hypothetical protein LBUL_0168 [Lactobacillus delbrueckii subsp. bulgaricus ATCC BAA-365]